MSALRLVLTLALRSLAAHRVKSVVVGGLLLFGTFFVVVGNALLGSIEREMEQTLTGSLAGHLQVYSADAKDPLALFGGFGSLGSTDIGEVPKIEAVIPDLSNVEHVAAVVPMGLTNATVFGRNDIDQVLTDLRGAAREGRSDDVWVGRVRRIVDDLANEAENQAKIGRPEEAAKTRDALAHVSDPAFWAPLAEASFEPVGALAALDYLDSRIAPLATDARVLYLRVVGTDPVKFAETFPRFHVVEGQAIPPGKPGFLFSHRTYEELIKNPVAVELDKLHRERTVDGKSIATDPLLQERVRRNADQYRRITFQLDPRAAEEVDAWLVQQQIPGADLDERMRSFLTVTDETLAERRDGFYEMIAPRIALYAFEVGKTITLRGFTRSGFLKAVEVPIYGTYEFTGLEDAGFQSASNLVDLVTFRELYGKMSDRAKDELADIRKTAGIADVSREDAEAALFGGAAAPIETVVTSGGIDVDLQAVEVIDPFARSYPAEDLQNGLALNLAVVLDDPRRLEEVRRTLTPVAAAHGLQVVDWRTAAGTIGQFVTVIRMVLVAGLAIIFLVALIIVNNAMVMATLDRVPEIGTLRAIGAQRGTVVGLFLAETALLGLFAGALGAGLALALIGWLGTVGIPAPAPVLVILFGGPELYPTAGWSDVAFGLGAITFVAVVSTLYPALLAARVPPIVAMSGRE